MANNVLPVASGDFDNIKSELITFLGNQAEFQDFDFTGSAMNVLLDALAYATHYQMFYNNMTFNEMFLDSAKLRSSVVSKAKEIGYFPKQYTAATSNLRITADLSGEASPPTDILVTKGSKFTGLFENGNSYIFSSDSDYTLNDNSDNIFTGTINLVQGFYVTDKFTYDTNKPETQMILSNSNIDTEELIVVVRDFESSSITRVWNNEKNITNTNPTSQVYFLEETDKGMVQVLFGNGTIGQELLNTNVVEVTYLKTAGIDGNQISKLSLNNSIDGWQSGNFVLTDITKSSGGSQKEGISDIKNNAPKNYQFQNRCVTVDDYRSLVLREVSNIKSLNVWGGELDIPPAFGKLRMAFRTIDGSELTPRKKQTIIDTIKKFNMITITPEIVTPDHIYIDVYGDVSFNFQKTSLTAEGIKTLVVGQISSFFSKKLLDFDSTFRYSEFITNIDEADDSILSNNTYLKLTKKFISTIGATSLILDFNNAINENSFISNIYTADSSDLIYLFDDGNGLIWDNINGVNQIKSIGTIDYITGLVTIDNYNFYATNAAINFTVTPTERDILSERLVLLEEGTHNITITEVL